MNQSPDVMWGLTKRWNNSLVKFQRNWWTKSTFSMTGRWNASEAARTVGVSGSKVEKDAEKGTSKRVFTVSLRTKQKNGIAKRTKNSQRVPGGSVCNVNRDVNAAAKAINSLTYQNQRDKTLALRKLARLSAANASTGAGVKNLNLVANKGRKGKRAAKN